MKYYPAIKQNESLRFDTIKLESTISSEISQIEKDKFCMI